MPYFSVSDEELISLLKKGDHDAFTEIYKRYSGVLLAHTLKRLSDTQEAMDIVQELFTYLWVKRDDLIIHSTLSGYLYASVRNRVINCIARQSISSKYYEFEQQGKPSLLGATDHLVREKQLTEIIEKEIHALPKRMREVFELSRFQELSHKEIAFQLDISELTVKKQVNKALRILRVKLGLYTILFVALVQLLFGSF